MNPEQERTTEQQKRHPSTFDPFCADVSAIQRPNYDKVTAEAVRAYPGAKNAAQALAFLAFAQQRRIDRAISHYSEQASRRDASDYAESWVARYLVDISEGWE